MMPGEARAELAHQVVKLCPDFTWKKEDPKNISLDEKEGMSKE